MQAPTNVACSNSHRRVRTCVITGRASEQVEANAAFLESLDLSPQGAIYNVLEKLLRAFATAKFPALQDASQMASDLFLIWGQTLPANGG
jgi:hypothetical protein